jgi:hypothetical protein
MELDFGFGFQEPKKDESKEKRTRQPRFSSLTRSVNTIYRKAYSELNLIDSIDLEYKDGDCVTCMTGGDVDGLTYLKAMIRKQTIEHCIMSTWCMAMDDVLQIQEWIEEGKIIKMDVYLGEIFPRQYPNEYKKIKEIISDDVGRVAIFKNHSKVFAGCGDKFKFGISMSCNINTNPRAENAIILIGGGQYEFYKEYFDQVITIDKD